MKYIPVLFLLISIHSSCSLKQTVHQYRGYSPDTVQQVCYHCLAKKNGVVVKDSAMHPQADAVEKQPGAVQKEPVRNYIVSGRRLKLSKRVLAATKAIPVLTRRTVAASRYNHGLEEAVIYSLIGVLCIGIISLAVSLVALIFQSYKLALIFLLIAGAIAILVLLAYLVLLMNARKANKRLKAQQSLPDSNK